MLQSGFYTWLISLFLDVGKNRGWGRVSDCCLKPTQQFVSYIIILIPSQPEVFALSNNTCHNQWENCISLDFNFHCVSEP
jgi:hypothetical protein